MKFEINGYKYDPQFNFEIKGYIKFIKDVIQNIDKSFILDVNNPNLLGSITTDYHERELYPVEKLILDNSDKIYIFDKMEDIAIKDIEWTKKRNKDYGYQVYVKYTFKPEIIEKVRIELLEILELLEQKLNEFTKAEKVEKEEKAVRKSQYRLGKIYREQYPRGGEEGRDGYIDAEIINNSSGESIRFVMRDVFDFGCYNYPKRVEGTKEVFERNNWTDEEKKISEWLNEFSQFNGYVRM
ncbi:hypothetical protein JK635_02030 [Neobacillus sp. YIM B02564]|uniref:Large polyvalent protein associated domain-containing protein n=1 Tax=Neobacillus paridis TaxID=2803862 RepID=A0ABS1TIL7_9BACI|nr:hypothetical protein [Neobacillus paridis]MBL4951018.1 hypothetical protein [Neobacillus paridis]